MGLLRIENGEFSCSNDFVDFSKSRGYPVLLLG
jgi:hypothetical protein